MRESRVSKEEEVSAHEWLRRRALEAAAEKGESHGWALLVGRGMVAWLRALSSYAPLGSATAKRTPVARVEEATDLSPEITRILTNMVFAVRS